MSTEISEETALLSGGDSRRRSERRTLWVVVGAALVAAIGGVSWYLLTPDEEQAATVDQKFPPDFIFGAATSSYQIEGAVHKDGRVDSIWDTFCRVNGTIEDHSNGDVACDHYHRVKEDVQLMKDINLQAYRFSIAWPRIMTESGEVNQKGIDFYNTLVDELIDNDIEPFITLYHWDLPQYLQDKNGWLNRDTVYAFTEYAKVCFSAFGDRVKYWITINEAWTVSVNGFATGVHAPGLQSPTLPYQVGHNLLLAHGQAVHAYREMVQHGDIIRGKIGLANCGDYRYPSTETKRDIEAAERAMEFQFGWFTDPILLGDYPLSMRELLGNRLPIFTEEESNLLKGSADFVGLNYYSSLLASHVQEVPTYQGYWADIRVNFTSKSQWKKNDMGWSIVPEGMKEMLIWISSRFGSPEIMVTENGTAERLQRKVLADNDRLEYLKGHLSSALQAINSGVKLTGYFAWSLMDNFEWQFGYTKRFGLYYVDYRTLERSAKESAKWYANLIKENKSKQR